MRTTYLLTLTALSSLLACWVGTRRLRLALRDLRPALARLCDFVGAGLLFYLANLTAGTAFALLARALTSRFVSLYPATDLSLLVLSCLQGAAFELWRAERRISPSGAGASP